MKRRKKLQELTIKDNFMFGAVMCDEKNCKKFLKFVGADLQESTEDYEDEFVKELQKSVVHVKTSREMEERFMLLELMLKDEHKAGKIEGKIEASIENLLELLILLRRVLRIPLILK